MCFNQVINKPKSNPPVNLKLMIVTIRSPIKVNKAVQAAICQAGFSLIPFLTSVPPFLSILSQNESPLAKSLTISKYATIMLLGIRFVWQK